MKKILIGVIISISILVSVSFTSVVGYHSIESNIGASPLFNIRTNRAIDEEDGSLSCEYVGKGDDFNLLIPDRDNRQALIQKLITIIRQLDEKDIREFIDFLKMKFKERDIIADGNDFDVNRFIQNSESNISKLDSVDPDTLCIGTFCQPCTFYGLPIFLCILGVIFIPFFAIIGIGLDILSVILPIIKSFLECFFPPGGFTF